MEYEEENRKLRDKIYSIDEEISKLKSFIWDTTLMTLDMEIDIARQNAQQRVTVLTMMKADIEETLKETPIKRRISNKISNILGSLPEIPDAPKKVYSGGLISKPVYSVSNGCFSWIMIIWVILAAIVFAFLAANDML